MDRKCCSKISSNLITTFSITWPPYVCIIDTFGFKIQVRSLYSLLLNYILGPKTNVILRSTHILCVSETRDSIVLSVISLKSQTGIHINTMYNKLNVTSVINKRFKTNTRVE